MYIRRIIFVAISAVGLSSAQDGAGFDAEDSFLDSTLLDKGIVSPSSEGDADDHPFLRTRRLAKWCDPITVTNSDNYPYKPTVYFKCPKKKTIKICWKKKGQWKGICKVNEKKIDSGKKDGTCSYTFPDYLPCNDDYKVKVHDGGRGTCSTDFKFGCPN